MGSPNQGPLSSPPEVEAFGFPPAPPLGMWCTQQETSLRRRWFSRREVTSFVCAKAGSADSFATVLVSVATVAQSSEVAVARFARESKRSEVKVREVEETG